MAEALGRHAQVFMSTPKEPNYFLYAGGNPYNLRLDRGVPHFQGRPRFASGSTAPTVVLSRPATARCRLRSTMS